MTGPAGVLRAMFAHHAWANATLLGFLDGLPPDRLRAVMPGMYGSILLTATHVIQADERYLTRLAGKAPLTSSDREEVELPLLRARARDHDRRWEGMLDRLAAGDLRSSITGRSDFPEVVPAHALLMVQAIHHGNEHRAQICSAIGAFGEEAPELDGWHLWLTGYVAPDR